MRTLALCLLAVCLGVPAVAEEPAGPDPMLYAEPKSDDSPTGFSCTVDTLKAGQQCVFESSAKPSDKPDRQAVDNVRQAGALAPSLCPAFARVSGDALPDKDLTALCQRDFLKAAESCGNGKLPLFDSDGRFAPTARACYFAMGEVLRRTHLMASIATPCCRCAAAKGHCIQNLEQCEFDLIAPTPRLPACAAAACESACSALMPRNPNSDLPDDPLMKPGAPPVKGANLIDL